VCQPADLRRLEPGQCRVASDLQQPLRPDALGDLVALGRRALVVPEQRRADHLAARVEEHRAVHLAGEPEAGDVVHLCGDLRQHRLGRPPPLRGILFGPARLRGEQVVRPVGLGDQLTLGGHGKRARAAGPDVDADQGRHDGGRLRHGVSD